MKKQDQLATLIHSLSPSEKRYFKIFCSNTKGEKSYMQLFDHIEQSQSHPQSGKRKSAETRVENLPRIRHYLFDLILRSLRSYHDDKGSLHQLYNKIIEIKILYEKGLYGLALDLVNKSLTLAIAHHLHSIRLDLIRWKSKIADALFDLDLMEEVIYVDYVEAQSLQQDLTDHLRYLCIYDKFFLYYKTKGTSAGPSEIPELDALMQDPLMSDANEPAYFYSRILYFSIKSSYTMLCGELQRSVDHLNQLMGLLHDNLEYVRESPKTYFAVMSNLVSRLARLRDKPGFAMRLKEFREFPELLPPDQRKIYADRVFENSLQQELEFYFNIGEFSRNYDLWKLNEKRLSSKTDKSPEARILTIASASRTCTMVLQFAESNRLINKVLQFDKKSRLREDILLQLYLLKIVNYYCLGDDTGVQLATKLFLKKCDEHDYRSQPGFDPDAVEFVRMQIKEFSTLSITPAMARKVVKAYLENLSDKNPVSTNRITFFYAWLLSLSQDITINDAYMEILRLRG